MNILTAISVSPFVYAAIAAVYVVADATVRGIRAHRTPEEG